MEKVRVWRGQPSDLRLLKNRTEQIPCPTTGKTVERTGALADNDRKCCSARRRKVPSSHQRPQDSTLADKVSK